MANEIKALNIGGTTYTIQPEYSNIAGKVNSPLKAGTKSYDGSAEVTITASDLGLSSALKYIGTSSTKVSDGGTESPTINGSVYSIPDGTSGQVVFYDEKEFVWNGSTWEFLGDDRNFKVIQSPVSDPAVDDATSTTFIDAISQDANGLITATKKRLPSYLSTSGGTINNGTFAPLKIAGTSTRASVGFSKDSSAYAYLTYNGGSNWAVTNEHYNNEYTLLHSGNYATEIGDYYLKSSGGTIKGVVILNGNDATNVPLNIVTPSMGNTGYIRFGAGADSNELGLLGFSAKGEPAMVYEGTVNTLIHSGNIGSQSVDKAKVLKDYAGSRITNANVDNFGDGGVRKYIVAGEMTTNKPPYNGSILHFSWDTTAGYDHQLFIANNPLASPNERMAWRGQNVGQWGDWKTIAFTDSDITGNAAGLKHSNGTVGAVVNESGNVTIGAEDKAKTSAKLYVNNGMVTIVRANSDTQYYGDNATFKICTANPSGASVVLGLSAHTSEYCTIQSTKIGTGAMPLSINPSGGNVLIGTETDGGYKLDVNGTARIKGNTTITGTCSASSGFFETSDSRLKDFKDPIKVDLDKLSKLTKAYFTFKNDPEKMHLGVSAQEIKEIYPEIVNENEEGFLSVDYAKLSVIALTAVDELNNRLNSIEERLSRLEK